MSQVMSQIEYLSKEIGPRPAGTEEEQQAALYITELFQKDAGFAASMEDFASASNVAAGFAVLAAIAVVTTVLAIIFPVLAIPAFILAAAAAVLYALESFDRPIISRVLSRGASQNVVAKYQPDAADGGVSSGKRARSRKVILVAHYDTGRVTPSLVATLERSAIPFDLVSVIAVIAAAFFLLIRIFIASGGGMGLLVLNVLSIIVAIVCLVPIAEAIALRTAPYNEGATNNATGTVALVEVARRIARGSVSEADLVYDSDGQVSIHGEEAARAEGLVPEGAQLRYEAEQLVPPSEIGDHSEEERLLSAKAAIAAMTGRPVERRVYGSVASHLVNSHASDEFDDAVVPLSSDLIEDGDPNAAVSEIRNASPAEGAPEYSQPEQPVAAEADGFQNAPSWFVAAQQNARKSERFNADEGPEIKRSRYTEAIESAERSLADREEERLAAELAEREEIQRAREEEARASIAPSEPSGGAATEMPADDAEPQSLEPQSIEQTGQIQPLPQSPYGTVAMAAPVPAAEILAEAAESGELPIGEQLSIPPVVEEEQPVQNRVPDLPAINPVNPSTPEPTNSPTRSGILRKLRTNIPSLSGLIAPVPSETGSTPAHRQPKQVDRASIPAIADTPATPAANQGLEAVEVPRSRSGNLINRFKKSDEETLVDTPQQWLNVDDDFEARSVGRARGGWESFRDDQYADDEPIEFGSGDDARPAGRSWQGGAFSRVQLGHVNTRSGVEESVEEVAAEEALEASDPSLSGEIEQIYHFRNPRFNTEIWFVAMGADGLSHDGARAFLEEHRDELRGSMIIEIESLGAGTLSVASDEGRIRKVTASSRVKRYTRGATAATGIAPDSVSLAGTDSIASTMQKAGFQAMHLFGAEDGRPALKGSADDVFENVDENMLDEHISFIFELLKS